MPVTTRSGKRLQEHSPDTKTNAETVTSLRELVRCSHCNCPGHNQKECFVYDPKRYIMNELTKPWTICDVNRIFREKEHARIERLGLGYKKATKGEYMKRWIRKNGKEGLTSRERAYERIFPLTVEHEDKYNIDLDERILYS